jgi:hypothetical protein
MKKGKKESKTTDCKKGKDTKKEKEIDTKIMKNKKQKVAPQGAINPYGLYGSLCVLVVPVFCHEYS